MPCLCYGGITAPAKRFTPGQTGIDLLAEAGSRGPDPYSVADYAPPGGD